VTERTECRQPFAHQALVYGSDAEFRRWASAFLQEAADRGEHAIVVTTEHNIGLLRDAGAGDKVEYIPASTFYTAPGPAMGAYYRIAETYDGPGRLRVIGEPVWHGRSEAQILEWHRYESAINIAFADTPSWIVCPYDTRAVPDGIVADAARTHPELIDPAGPYPSPRYQEPADFAAACDTRPLPEPDGRVFEHPISSADLRALRAFLRARAFEAGLSGDRLNDLVVAVNETATNVIRHGAGHGKLRIWTEDQDLVCEVTDHAGLLTDSLAGYRPPAFEATSGQGLWTARQLCDLFQVRAEPDRTVIRLHTRLRD
jgi:anti-sigma regulatory factor (Ser/Thr protein kinase)